MSLKTFVKLALAGAAVAASGSALAAGAPEFTFFMAGATATDRSLSDVFLDTTDGLCDVTQTGAAAADVFTTRATFTGTYVNYSITCKIKAGVTGLAGRTVAFVKYSGGSGTGVQNVANGTTLNSTGSAKWVSLACATASTNVAATSTTQEHNEKVNCPADATDRAPKAGISDVEPELLAASANDIARLNTVPGVAVVFAPVVSRAFFTALQTAQGIDPNGVCGTAGVLTGERAKATANCLPNLTTAQVRGMYKSGSAITNANRFWNTAGTQLASKTIFVCRRGDNSGTQAGFKTYYLRQGCGSGKGAPALSFVGPDNGLGVDCQPSGCAWDAAYLTDRVFAGTGSGDVRLCLDAHNNAGDFAIGTLTTEVDMNDTTDEWRFVKVDGVVPSLEKTVAGEWSFFTEDVYNTPKAPSTNLQTADEAALSTALLANLRIASSIKNSVITMPHGLGGILAVPSNVNSSPTPPITQSAVLASPVNSQTHASVYSSTAKPNNCNPTFDAGRTTTAVDDGT